MLGSYSIMTDASGHHFYKVSTGKMEEFLRGGTTSLRALCRAHLLFHHLGYSLYSCDNHDQIGV